MIPRPEWRVLAYLLCWAAATWVVVQRMLSHSQAAYDGGDLSAFAWTGFFPFLFPLFMLEAGFYLVLSSDQPWEDWISTRYEQKALREGRAPHYLTFQRP